MHTQKTFPQFRTLLSLSLSLVLALGGAVLADAPEIPPATNPPDLATISHEHTTPQSPFPGPDGQGYFVQVVPYAWIEIAGSGRPISDIEWQGISGSQPLDDGYAGPFEIGFRFPFYDELRSDFYLSTNGFITFGVPWVEHKNQCDLPDAAVPNKLIALMWDDLDLSYAGSVYYQSFETCPIGDTSCLVVEYVEMTHWAWMGGEILGSAGTWQAIIYADGAIVIQFKDPGVERGLESTTGIEGKNPDLDWGLTYACNSANSLYAGLAVRFSRVPGLFLKPQPLEVNLCPGGTTASEIELVNRTDLTATCVLTYTGSLSLAIAGPTALELGPYMTASLPISLTPLNCPFNRSLLTATVHASSGAHAAQMEISSVAAAELGGWSTLAPEPDDGRQDAVVVAWQGEIWVIGGDSAAEEFPVHVYHPASDTWRALESSQPPFGFSRPRSGVVAGEKVYLYGDAYIHPESPFIGLWSYNLGTNVWQQESPAGTPPPFQGIAYPAWVRDPATGYLYMTGGSLSWLDAGTLGTVFVYDPAENRWLTPLPRMTTARNLHAAFINRDKVSGHRRLCVLGGLSLESMYLSSTQCYDLDEDAWHAENTDLGALPITIWGMAFTERMSPNGMQWWLIGGQQNGDLSRDAWYFDLPRHSWHKTGSSSQAVNRAGAAVVDGDLFKVGGSLLTNETVGALDRYRAVPCERCRFTVQVALEGPGSVVYKPLWPGFLAGETVYLTALPGWGAHWEGWSGDMTSAANPLMMTISGDTWLTATFGAQFTYLPMLRAR
ncbi:MAG: Kelch repeat-containing protein [Anaerolineae bacterium]